MSKIELGLNYATVLKTDTSMSSSLILILNTDTSK